jgi:hypothetical protein
MAAVPSRQSARAGAHQLCQLRHGADAPRIAYAKLAALAKGSLARARIA